MASKVSLEHAYKVLEDKENYKLIDTLNAISYISVQSYDKTTTVNSFYVRTSSSSVYSLYKAIRDAFDHMSDRSTITHCINKLISLNILKFNNIEEAWELLDMGKMLRKGSEGCGYLDVRNYLLTESFYNTPISIKKVIYYSICLMSSKKFHDIKQIVANLKDKHTYWYKIINSNNMYYIKSIFNRLIKEYNLFEDVSEEKRQLELNTKHQREKYISPDKYKRIRNNLRHKIFFKPLELITSKIGNKSNLSGTLSTLKKQYRHYYSLVSTTIYSCGNVVQTLFTNELMIALIRSTANLGIRVQTLVLDKVVTKLETGEAIYAPYPFIRALLKTTI